MRFWDSSAIVPLILHQPSSSELTRLARDSRGIAVWWGSIVECTSAVTRTSRAGIISAPAESKALGLLNRIAGVWAEVQPTELVRQTAQRLLRVHPLRAADAFQLAAALSWADGASGLPFVTRDTRLADAAGREGFDLI